MDLKTLTTFRTVAQYKSFSMAAKELGYTQAAVTIHIQRLEVELQVQLFDRFPRTIELTQEGKILLQHADNILIACEQAKKAMKEEVIQQGDLHIGIIESLCASIFPSIIQQFHITYPSINIQITTGSPALLIDMMNHNKLDIVYFIDKKQANPSWIKVMEIPEEIVFVTHAHHPLLHKQDLRLADILQEKLLLTEKKASYREELEQHIYAQHMNIQPFLEIGNTSFLIDLLLKEMGISFLPRFTIESYLEEGSLRILHPKDFSMFVWRQMLYHKTKWITPQMKAFLAMMEKN